MINQRQPKWTTLTPKLTSLLRSKLKSPTKLKSQKMSLLKKVKLLRSRRSTEESTEDTEDVITEE